MTKNSNTTSAETLTASSAYRRNMYTPEELKILVDALNGAPSYLSKRFILKQLCGWTDEMLEENAKMKKQENEQNRIGDHTWR